MQSVSVQVSPDKIEGALEKIKAISPDLVVLFTSSAFLSDPTISDRISSILSPNAHIIGCSTSGEMGDRVDDDSLAIMGMSFSATPLESASVEITGADQSFSGGADIAKKLMKDDLRAIFVLSPGKDINGSILVEGIKSVIPPNVTVFGGLAGGGYSFGTTYTLLDGTIKPNQIAAIGFYGDKINVGTGSQGGWKTFGPLRKVTKSVDNVLYELDGKPALDLYKQYLGDKAEGLPGSGLLYPFAILNKDTKEPELIRTILDINEADKSMVFAGNIEEGADVSLMHAGNDELIEGATAAANIISDKAPLSKNSATICVSCIGRKLLMGLDTEDELDAVKDVLNPSSFLGFYSNGEISSLDGGGSPKLHNQTMTITYLYENE